MCQETADRGVVRPEERQAVCRAGGYNAQIAGDVGCDAGGIGFIRFLGYHGDGYGMIIFSGTLEADIPEEKRTGYQFGRRHTVTAGRSKDGLVRRGGRMRKWGPRPTGRMDVE